MNREEQARCRRILRLLAKGVFDEAEARALAAKMKLMSHPARIQILSALARGDACVCVLSELVGRSQPNVSQHLTKLKDCGIISDYHVGKFVYYKLNDSHVRKLLSDL